MMDTIDFRSDTITQPTDSMRAAMQEAKVGDDVYQEDPSVIALEKLSAKITGKKASLFVPSGTMGNLLSLLSHCQRGDEIILGQLSHIYLNEVGGASALGGLHPRAIKNLEDGTFDTEELVQAIRKKDIHYPQTTLICLENTHNFCHGSPLPLSFMSKIRSIADQNQLKVHLDGARLFNAACHFQVEISDLTQDVDSVMFCLSKALSAPVGSMLCGTQEFICRARKFRKMLGGGMRQSGHLANAALTAIKEQAPLLKTDHELALKMGTELEKNSQIKINPSQIRTNIFYFTWHHPKFSMEELYLKLRGHGILVSAIENGSFRIVTHRHINREKIDRALKIISDISKTK